MPAVPSWLLEPLWDQFAGLLAEVYPGVRLTREVSEFGTLLAIDRAREALGFDPAHSWRDHVNP